jgi:hypothetical protein
MEKVKKLTRAEIERQLNEAWEQMLKESNLNPDPNALKRLMKMKGAQPQIVIAGGMTITLGALLQNMGKTIGRNAKIENDKQLQAVLREIKEMGNQLPTAIRKATKAVTSALPRRGGPGRQPKLQPDEARQMCDQIALFIRQQSNLKEALQKVSALTPSLLGKKVSPRTLQKAWDKRGERGTD